ncbi:MAG: ribonuclease HI [Terriglobia bacterium]
MQDVILTCDGSAVGNPGPGGWASILRLKSSGQELVITGSHPATTNNRMELTAAIEALRALRRHCRIELQTDSQYVKKGITEWLPRWRSNGWVTASGKPVLNQDLWHQLEQVVAQHEVHWSWTPGHTNDNKDQNRADQLALAAARQQAAALGRG